MVWYEAYYYYFIADTNVLPWMKYEGIVCVPNILNTRDINEVHCGDFVPDSVWNYVFL